LCWANVWVPSDKYPGSSRVSDDRRGRASSLGVRPLVLLPPCRSRLAARSVHRKCPSLRPKRRVSFLSTSGAGRGEFARPHSPECTQSNVWRARQLSCRSSPACSRTPREPRGNPARKESQRGQRPDPSPKSTFPKCVPGQDRELVKNTRPRPERTPRCRPRRLSTDGY
jgi:hypothetical protein